jgi:SAM-dependent methyltransferase
VVTAMSWRKLLLLPSLIRHGARAPRALPEAWEDYWQGVSETGRKGDVLWDPAHDVELQFCLQKLGAGADRALPVIDVGCGNGRFTRALSSLFEPALGLDLAPSAVKRAGVETAEAAKVSYRCLDATKRGWAEALHRELGDANVFIRGVLHVLNHQGKVALADELRVLLGQRGTLFLLETAFPGSPLDYLEFLGAVDGTLPAPLERAIRAGLPQPASFAAPELARYFPDTAFRVLESGPADIFAVGMRRGSDVEKIPGFYALIRTV